MESAMKRTRDGTKGEQTNPSTAIFQVGAGRSALEEKCAAIWQYLGLLNGWKLLAVCKTLVKELGSQIGPRTILAHLRVEQPRRCRYVILVPDWKDVKQVLRYGYVDLGNDAKVVDYLHYLHTWKLLPSLRAVYSVPHLKNAITLGIAADWSKEAQRSEDHHEGGGLQHENWDELVLGHLQHNGWEDFDIVNDPTTLTFFNIFKSIVQWAVADADSINVVGDDLVAGDDSIDSVERSRLRDANRIAPQVNERWIFWMAPPVWRRRIMDLTND